MNGKSLRILFPTLVHDDDHGLCGQREKSETRKTHEGLEWCQRPNSDLNNAGPEEGEGRPESDMQLLLAPQHNSTTPQPRPPAFPLVPTLPKVPTIALAFCFALVGSRWREGEAEFEYGKWKEGRWGGKEKKARRD